MNKVINPLKQPTKKRSPRSPRSLRSINNSNLKIAIEKIESHLVKDNIKLVKGGGGSPGNTKLILSKNLMKGGEISEDTRQEIINLLKKYAPKVNDLKHELIMKLIERMVDHNNINDITDLHTKIINLHNDFKKGLYKYEFKLEQWINDQFKDTEILDDLIILDIVRKYYILLRVKKGDFSEFQSYNFVKLTDEIIENLNTPDMEKLRVEIEKYKGIVSQSPPEEPSVVEIELEIRIVAAIAAIPAITAALPIIDEAIEKDEKPNIDEVIKGVSVDAAKAAASAAATKSIANYKNIVEDNRIQIIKRAVEGAATAVVAGVLALYEDEATSEAIEEKEVLAEDANEEDKKVLEKTTKARAHLDAVKLLYKKLNIVPTDKQNNDAIIDNPLQNKKKEVLAKAVAAAAITEVSASQEEKNRAIAKATKAQTLSGGKPAPKYKSTGQVVNIMYKKRKYKRTIFVKEKRKTKYCKINNEYILLSKLNVM